MITRYEDHLPDFSETSLQIATADYLRGEIHHGKNIIRVQKPFPGLVSMHPCNEFKDAKEAFWAVRKGILKGANDWIFWWPGNNFGTIELKLRGKAPSPDQIDFGNKIVDCGGKKGLAYSVAELRDILIGWGIECKNMQAREPQLSFAAKKRANFEWQRPIDGIDYDR